MKRQTRNEAEKKEIMKPSISSLNWRCCFATVAAVTLLATGCATNGRYVLLKEYSASGPTAQPLQGATICIKPFHCASNLTSPDPTTQSEQPEQFKYVEFTAEENKNWDHEFRALKKSTTQADWREIGNLRNLFGMVMSHVYALNDPGAWLADTLKMDLEGQGAKVVEAAQADSADLCLSGTVQFCRVDMYMKIWGDLVVDLELQPKDGDVSHKTLHTSGGQVAWVGSTSEFYQPLRECRQKFSHLASREVIKALKRPGLVTVSKN